MNSYKTKKQKIETLSNKGNIITFKKKYKPSQVIVSSLIKNKKAVRIVGVVYSSYWYENMDKLINAVDWKWMQNNIIND